MRQHLPYDEIIIDEIVKLENILTYPDDSIIGYNLDCELSYPERVEEKTEIFLFCPEKEVSSQDKLSD